MNSDLFGVGLAVVLLALNAFFVGAEFALLSARRSQIEPRAQEGSRVARTTLRAMENVSLVMAGAQLGITVCSLGLGAVGEPAVAHLLEPLFHAARVPDDLLHPVSFVVALSIVVYLHVVLGEMVPKNIALAGADRAALVLSPPMMVIVTVLRPVIAGMNMVANAVLRLLRVEPKDEVHSSFTREEVAALVEESRGEGLIEADEYDRLAGALGFTEKTVASIVMTPDGLATVAPGSTVADVEARVRRDRLQPVPGRRRRTARCWATCTSRTCSSPTTTSARGSSRTSGSGPSPRCTPTTCSTTRSRACRPRARTWRGWCSATVRSSGSSRSRTSSRSWSARSATPRTTTCPPSTPPECWIGSERCPRKRPASGPCPTSSAWCGSPACPVFLWLVLGPEADAWALVVLMVSGFTDFLDGWLARRLDQYSRLGEILDPVADRLYILAVVVGLALRDIIPWWVAVSLPLRDLLMWGLVPILRTRGYSALPVHFLGKAATFNLLYAFPLLLLGDGEGVVATLARRSSAGPSPCGGSASTGGPGCSTPGRCARCCATHRGVRRRRPTMAEPRPHGGPTTEEAVRPLPDHVTTPLLTLITAQSMDEDYAHVAQKRAAAGLEPAPSARARTGRASLPSRCSA